MDGLFPKDRHHQNNKKEQGETRLYGEFGAATKDKIAAENPLACRQPFMDRGDACVAR